MIYVADGELVPFGDSTARDNELAAATEYSDAVRSTAMIDEVCRPVKSSSGPQQCLVRNAERIDFQNTEDMYNEFKVIYINC